jgi:MraZ protein
VEKTQPVLEEEVRGLPVFVGDYTHSLDPKKRLTIPSVWRAQVGSPKSLFVMPDFYEKCLNVFPAGEMFHKLQKFREHSLADKKAMQFASVLGSASDLVPWDAQGRIRIKDKLLEFAGLVHQVVLVGALNKFQIWSRDRRQELDGIDQVNLAEAGRYVAF